MAFVPASAPLTRSRTCFTAAPIETSRPIRLTSLRTASKKQVITSAESSSSSGGKTGEFGKAGASQWKENSFTGGMPGGEEFYQSWVESGMTKDFPDLPDTLQAKTEFKPPKVKKEGVLGMLDDIEFFPGFSRDPTPDTEVEFETSQSAEGAEGSQGAEGAEGSEGATPGGAAKPAIPDEDAPPNEELYAPHFPANIRYIAPEINIVYEKSFVKDRVSVAMTEVTASPTDVYYPKQRKKKAPIIKIFYGGSLANAYVSLKFDDVEGLPTLPPPPKDGDAVTTLVPGQGGGLKLDFSVAGAGPVNI